MYTLNLWGGGLRCGELSVSRHRRPHRRTDSVVLLCAPHCHCAYRIACGGRLRAACRSPLAASPATRSNSPDTRVYTLTAPLATARLAALLPSLYFRCPAVARFGPACACLQASLSPISAPASVDPPHISAPRIAASILPCNEAAPRRAAPLHAMRSSTWFLRTQHTRTIGTPSWV